VPHWEVVMRRSSFSALAAVIATLSLAYIGCSEATTSTIVDSVASVLVSPGSATVQVNQTTQLTAVARGESGAVLSGHTVTWSSSSASVATVNASGVVQGVSAGHATITASAEGQSGSADVTVESTPVATITITPAAPTIGVNGTVQLAAIPKDANGNELSGRTITWESSASGTASVSGAGLVTGVAAGQATITARSEGQSGSTTVTVQALPPVPVASVAVTPPSATVQVNATTQLTAVTRDAGGNVLSGRAVTWSTSAAGTATVSASGLVRGVAAGQATITATSEGQTGTSSITVQVAPVATVTVAPANPSIAINGTVQLSATLKDAGGNVLTGRSVTWSTSASGTATVSGSGLVTGVAAGQATITATSEGQAGTSTVTVQAPAPVATVTVSPSAPNVSIGASTQLTATLKDASGNVLTGRTITWSSSATSIATVSSTGLVTGVAAGQATVTATSEGQSGTSTITVPAPPPPPSGTVADPTQLPLASGQSPPSGTYGRTLSAGQTYNDPVSGLPVLKVTDATTPASNSRGHHDYSEGGPYISQPWQGTDGNTYYTLMVAAEPNRYLVDVRYDDMTLSNWRVIDLDGDLSFAFSLNPATPRIAFVELNSLSNVVQRYNTATNKVENTGNWPWRPAAGSINWLQTQLNDTWLVAMGNNVTIVAFRPSDGLMRSYSPANLDEPHIDREQPFTYMALGNQVWVCNLTTGAACFNAPGDPSWSYQPNSLQNADHSAPLRGHIVGIANSANLKYYSYDVLANVTSSYIAPSQAAGFPGEEHRSGVWVFNNGNGNTSQWWTIDPSGGTDSNAKIRSGMIGMVNIDGSPTRIVAVHNSTGGQASYQTQPHTTLAPDGKWVMWSSDNKSGGRTDVFLVRMPTK
jgi:uncharacterized protein YjdB